MKKESLVGKKFGKLTVTQANGKTLDGKLCWDASCDCGNEVISIMGTSLRRKNGTKSCGCLKKTHFVDFTGKVFNKLRVVRYVGKDNSKNNIYECLCECGNHITAQGSDLKMGKVKTCGCGRFTKAQEQAKLQHEQISCNQLHAMYENKAKHRQIEFKLTIPEMSHLIKQACSYCGVFGSNLKRRRAKVDTFEFRYNGLDRVDNNLGYALSNVVPCCRYCNQAKHSMTKEFFLEWVERVYFHSVEK